VIVFDRVSTTLHKPRRHTVVLDRCSVTFPTDRVVGLLAHPRTGKSTVLQLSSGAIEPERGRVRRSGIMSFPVGTASPYNAQLTLRENLVFICRLNGFDPKPVIAFVADFANLGAVLDRKFGAIEKDHRAEFLYSASYAMPFDIYAVDDNLVAGSTDFRARLDELARERMESAGFVIATSAPQVLKKYCTAFFVLKDHTIVEVGSPDEAVAHLGPRPKRGAGADNEDGDGEDDAPAAEGDGLLP